MEFNCKTKQIQRVILFSVAIIILALQNSSGQNYLKYYEIVNRAEIANLDGNFEKSDSLYKIAFQQVERPFNEDYLLASINAEKLKDFHKSYEYLKKGVFNGLTLKRIKKRLSEFKKSIEYKRLKKEYYSLHQKHLNTLNLPVREEIIEMIKNDQKARAPIFGGWRKMKKTDSYNYNRLLEIIKQNNNKWPGFSTIGEISPKGKYNVTERVSLMILHFSAKQVEHLKPFMLQAVYDGEMYPYDFARIIDYCYMWDVGCQPYGTYFYNKEVKQTEICDCEKVNEKRRMIGFESIQDFYRKLKTEYKCSSEE